MALTMLVIVPPTSLSMRHNICLTDVACFDVWFNALIVTIIIRYPHLCHRYYLPVDHAVTYLKILNAALCAEWWCSQHTSWTKQISWEIG
jgi:hypothetical protein